MELCELGWKEQQIKLSISAAYSRYEHVKKSSFYDKCCSKKLPWICKLKMLGLLNILKHYRCAKLLQRVSNHIYSVSSQFVSFFYQQTFIRGCVPSKTQIILRWLLTGCELFFAWIRIQPLACTENWHHKESRQHYKVKFNDCKRKSIFWFFWQDPNQS